MEQKEGVNSLSKRQEQLRDTFSGTCAGIASIVIGHPFDTVKVRLQVPVREGMEGARFSGILDCIRKTIRHEGVFGLYKGVLPPLCLEAVTNSILFSAYGSAQRFLLSKKRTEDLHNIPSEISSDQLIPEVRTTSGKERSDGLTQFSFTDHFICGGWAGMISCLIITPTELVKTRMQIEQAKSLSPIETIRTIVNTRGPRGLFIGFGATAFRDIYSFGLYFAVYETLKEKWKNMWGGSALAGGLAGVIAWVSSYPFDVIKSRIQTDHLVNPTYGSVYSATVSIYREAGFRPFFAGITTTILRAFPVNVALLGTYEFVYKLLS